MSEIDNKSVKLTKKLGQCSNSLAGFITKYEDIATVNNENDAIVFITHSPEQIRGALLTSLKNNRISLDHIFVTAKDHYVSSSKTQVFVTTNDPLEANRFKSQNSKSIIVDFTNEISSKNIMFYMGLMVKNIGVHIKFNINKEIT